MDAALKNEPLKGTRKDSKLEKTLEICARRRLGLAPDSRIGRVLRYSQKLKEKYFGASGEDGNRS
jgi:hypothetical protein